jgi:hypothetical protein
MLVVLDRLTPAERLAFVLHDTFVFPFDEVAAIPGRSATAGEAAHKPRPAPHRIVVSWWTWSGSNRRPHDCQSCALPTAPQAL